MKLNRLLFYTMPTFNYIDLLKKNFSNVFKLDKKMKKSLSELEKIIIKTKPAIIVGLAHQPRNKPFFYTKAVNRFHITKSVVKDGPQEYKLYVPANIKEKGFSAKPPRKYPTFCNWAAYKMQHFIEVGGLNLRHAYAHIQKRQDLTLLNENFFTT